MFQSLLGFLMRCDPALLDVRTWNKVSIPAGFSDALRPTAISGFAFGGLFQSLLGFLMRCDPPVAALSIPTSVRFQSLLGFLMRCDFRNKLCQDYLSTAFQSLLGFLMRCDARYAGCSTGLSTVSIPAGFSDALRLHHEHHRSSLD